jgi:polyisoprenoid-binding protein YceI
MKTARTMALFVIALFVMASCASRSEKMAEIMERLEAGEIPDDVSVFALDKSESTLKWDASKVTGAHYGTVDIKHGEIYVYDGVLLAGNVLMDMSSIVVLDLQDPGTNATLRNHLKSDDFFSVENHPESKLEIVRFDVIEGAGAEEANYRVFANLTIKDITHGISFDARIIQKDESIQAHASFDIDRTLWDIRFRSGKFFENLGDNLIHDLFTITFDIKARQ